jgi:NitT/TauT family transport system substrate-binding protein
MIELIARRQTNKCMEHVMRKLIALFLLLSFCLSPAFAGTTYRIAWSHYTGWEPWGYANDNGIIKKWADKYGIEIEVTLVNDYIESINLYTAGHFDACTMTNMDALTIPAVGGVDTTAVVIGDFSNGNDGIVMKNGTGVKDLKGRNIMLVELSVSHYMLARALDMNGLSERDVKLTNISDAEIASAFVSDANAVAVTWNPPLQQVRNAKGATMVFDSSRIPGEIIDLLAVKTSAPPELKKALAGAWYETMQLMTGRNKASKQALEFMAQQAGGTLAEFKSQLKTTAMFYDAAEADTFSQSADLKKTMDQVRTFAFDKGLYGNGASSKDLVGIEFPDKSVVGDKGNIKLRFDNAYMKAAAQGKL